MAIWICDVNGVLVDTPALIRAAFAATAAFYRVPFSELRYQRVKGLPLLEAYQRLDRGGDAAARRRYHLAYVRERIAAVRAYPGVAEELSQANAAGVRIGAATSHGEIAEACLVGTQLYSLIDCLVTQEEVRRPKPDPESILRALALLARGSGEAVRERALFIGDTAIDIEAGRAAGITTIGATYGVSPDAEIRAAGPDHVIHDFGEMRRFLPASASVRPSLWSFDPCHAITGAPARPGSSTG